MIDWFVDDVALASALGILAGTSLATFIISLLLIPVVVARLPQDCFLKLRHPATAKPPLNVARIVLLALRNVFGMILLLAGIVMLFLPGQGLLTILLGILLLSIPGKSRLVLSLTASPASRRGLDWLRRKSGKPPFLWPQSPARPQRLGEKGQ